MACYQLVSGSFREVEDPVAGGDGSYEDAIREAGYVLEVTSAAHLQVTPWIMVFKAQAPGLPLFYVDVMGMTEQIACFVADDAPTLLATLQQVQPLLMMGGDRRPAPQGPRLEDDFLADPMFF